MIELLTKTISDPIDKRKDNSDKKELFTKARHPQPANFYKDKWNFIENATVREILHIKCNTSNSRCICITITRFILRLSHYCAKTS